MKTNCRIGHGPSRVRALHVFPPLVVTWTHPSRSEEHTSELQSPCNLVCRLLLEKKVSTFSSLSEPLADERTTGHTHQTDQAQTGLDGQRDRKVPPNTVRIVVPHLLYCILLRSIMYLIYPQPVRFRQ